VHGSVNFEGEKVFAYTDGRHVWLVSASRARNELEENFLSHKFTVICSSSLGSNTDKTLKPPHTRGQSVLLQSFLLDSAMYAYIICLLGLWKKKSIAYVYLVWMGWEVTCG
jgi:hypothetical protein